ncbi:MAG: hypothetical protein DRJ05_10770 [Bacteroidetes bacterium]|nr:MAG: hypothetical protein DRJ05_10770 [Bacteroidota bacterium]
MFFPFFKFTSALSDLYLQSESYTLGFTIPMKRITNPLINKSGIAPARKIRSVGNPEQPYKTNSCKK